MNPCGQTAAAAPARDGAPWQASAGVCPAIHVRLARRRTAAMTVVRAAARRLSPVTHLLARVTRVLARG